LLATAALAEDFATSLPEDEFLDRIASLCRDALSRHLTGRTAAAGSNPSSEVA
jgi:hypothetical protein